MDLNKTKQKETQAGNKLEFQSKLENAPHDRTGHQSPYPTLTSFPLFSYIDFGGQAMQIPSYLYTAQWSKGPNQNCST